MSGHSHRISQHHRVGLKRRGKFARLAVCVDLRKPLVSKVRINGRLQQVEYEALPNIFFKCGLYGHGADLWRSQVIGEERNGCSDGAFGGSQFAAFGDLRGENLGSVDGKIDGEMEERNQGQIKGVGDNGVFGLQMTKGTWPKSSPSTLRPNNSRFGVTDNVGHGVYDDGSKLGLMGATDQGKNIVIQPVDVSLNLNKEKHTAVHIMERKNMDLYNDKENEMFRFSEKSGVFQELQSRVHNIIFG
ncbi:hypothetical protein J1N35_028424 [Gossypium stocksii]|uniref:Zinc knuckle CX2CX4HX4C domain-containing protein n=1 Tax=Gossypium stocksii TaxID=47602 RepID=A0A9D3UVY2_9ROSI|nr:hypothetical protein J1N35_028424 [Gossypium stocksii]